MDKLFPFLGGGGEKRRLEEDDSFRILTRELASENSRGQAQTSEDWRRLSSSEDEDEEEEDRDLNRAIGQLRADATVPIPVASVPEVKKTLSEDDEDNSVTTTGPISSVPELKKTLEAEQKALSERKVDEEVDDQKRISSRSSSDEDDHHINNNHGERKQADPSLMGTPPMSLVPPGERLLPQTQSEVAPLGRALVEAPPRPEEEEKAESPVVAPAGISSSTASSSSGVKFSLGPSTQGPQEDDEKQATMLSSPTKGALSPLQQKRLSTHSKTSQMEVDATAVGDEALIFKSVPVIGNMQIEYSVGSLNLSHINFVMDMRYEEQTWRVLCHRQNLIEFHTNLKSIRLQKRVQKSLFNPLGWCFGKRSEISEESQLLESMVDHPESTMKRLSSAKRLSVVQNKKLTLEDSIKEIHFPRGLIMSDRPHWFQKGKNLNEVNDTSKETLDHLKKNVLSYLNKVLESKLVRNLPCTLELFRCSALSFDKTLGPSIIEGWVRFQRHSPSVGAVTWHTCRAGCLACNCALVPISNSTRFRAWIVVKGSFAAFLRKPLDPVPMFVLIFDTGFDILKGFTTTGHKKHIYLHSNTVVADLTFNSRNEKKLWAQHLKQLETTNTSWQNRDHPHGSFAPEREDHCFGKFIVDGEAYFAAVAEGLESAKSEIYISGWWVTPDVILKRHTSEGNDYWTLRSILKRKAEEGVKVYVFMFKEVEVAIGLNSKFQESRLARIPNVCVLRHPNFTLGGSWYWSHHEKLVVIDSARAFMGGLDLCWGRFDNASHSLLDNPLRETWPGLDYYNPRIQDIPDPRVVDRDVLDRDTDPRMPWHDVSCQVSGPPARDLARHFVHQWNYAITTKSGSRSDLPMIIPRDFPSFPDPAKDHFKVKTQVLRSLPAWSGGPEDREEKSIQEAYISAIAAAERYVFIENQFFVSGLQGDMLILNRIAEALYQRIARAAAEKKDFKVIVFIPLLPAFEGAVDDSGQAALRQVLFWQYRTICRGENRRSLWQALEDNPDVKGDPSKYLSFFALRTFDKSQASAADDDPKIFTEMVYIHSKVMIVDDHVSFIGSANVNDRSMTGRRDSELCVKFVDTTFIADAKLGGEPWPLAGNFARGLRMRLFEEHFGQSLPSEVLEDFILPENFERMRALARTNTELYEKAFNLVPSDRILTFGDLKRNGKRGSRPPAVAGAPADEPTAEEEDEEFSETTTTGAATDTDTASTTVPAAAAGKRPHHLGEYGAATKLKRFHSFSSLDKDAPGGESFKERIAHLNGVYGHVVEFPLKFLSRARKLKPTGGIISDIIFT